MWVVGWLASGVPRATVRFSELLAGSSQKAFELFNCQTCVANDTAHRERVDWVGPWDGQDPGPVGHHDVLALSSDLEPGPLESANSVKMVDAWELRHSQTATSISRTSRGSIC